MQQLRRLGVLNHDPLVIYTRINSFLPLKPSLLELIASVVTRPYTLVVQVDRALLRLGVERPSLVNGIAIAIRRHAIMQPQTRVWFACATPEDVAAAEARGWPALLLSGQAFIDDGTLRLRPLQKLYDAVWAAPVPDYEHLELAALVEPLVVVPWPVGAAPDPPDAIERRLPLAQYAGHCRSLEDTALVIGSARAGLLLGADEGPTSGMLAYWLSGLPVVAVAAEGRRNQLLDASRTVFCADTQIGVANGISIAIAREFDPIAIRRGVLPHLWNYRNEWRQFMTRVCTAFGNAAGNRFEEQFKALRGLDTAANLLSVASLARVVAKGSGVADPAGADQ